MTQDLQPDVPLQHSAAPLACVDIGGTKVAVSVVDQRGMHARISEPTCKTGESDAVARQVIALVRQSCASAGLAASDLAAVGVASCGPFVVRSGLIELAAPNICGALGSRAGGTAGRLPNDWRSAPLEGLLRSAFKNVRIQNDAVAALEAERRWGALRDSGQPLADCAYVTWSTGVGVGLCVDGHILRGKHGNAGHAGHQFVSDNLDALCGCGNVGDVEALVGGQAIGRRFTGSGYAGASVLLAAARCGDAAALKITGALCAVMGRMLYNLVATLDLKRISIGGSVFWNHREFLLPQLADFVARQFPALTDGCELVSAGLGQRVGDFAALAVALAAVDELPPAASSAATAPTRAA